MWQKYSISHSIYAQKWRQELWQNLLFYLTNDSAGSAHFAALREVGFEGRLYLFETRSDERLPFLLLSIKWLILFKVFHDVPVGTLLTRDFPARRENKCFFLLSDQPSCHLPLAGG
jgi:hypothetical protein